MTEEEARAWIADTFGSERRQFVAGFLDRVACETRRQNLIAPSTLGELWSRHAVDSAQLLALAPERWSHWLDIGTGGGFPGMIVALLAPERRVTMVEPRRKRADFLQNCMDAFGLGSAQVIAAKIESVATTADVISARAVTTVEKLLHAARQCATAETTWLFPRGRSGQETLAALPQSKQSMFHVEHSIVDPESAILVLKGHGP